MAAEDFAILVGISTYADPQYKSLDGPPNDIALMKQWLLAEAGGNVPLKNIVVIESTKPPTVVPPYGMSPNREEFDVTFNQLIAARKPLEADRLSGRLYLYFSGHGFCNRDIERGDSEAALHTANATQDTNQHVFGTFYARTSKGWPMFQETILIMDCCRSSEINRKLIPGTATLTPDEMLSARARLMTVYAAPKGGLAQERKIKERKDEVYGLLTHALIKALDEARPTGDNTISSAALKDFVLRNWETVCGPDAPPPPEIFLPPNGEILFGARNTGTSITVKFLNPQPPGAMFTLRNSKLEKVADLSATGVAADDLVRKDGPLLFHERQGAELVLRLQPGFYEYSASSGVSGTIKIPGEDNLVTV
jgi:hypothetical protein